MTETTPEWGFPLPSDQSRISAFPWHLRALSRTLEEKLPGAILSTVNSVVPGQVKQYAADLTKKVDDAVATLAGVHVSHVARDSATGRYYYSPGSASAAVLQDSATGRYYATPRT